MFRSIVGFAATLTFLWLITSDTGAQPRPLHANKAQPLNGWPRDVTGYGKTVDEAKQNALKQAVVRVEVCLKSQNPPLDAWQPDEKYVRNHLLEGPGQPGEDVKLAANAEDQGLVAKTWIQRLRESPNWAAMVQLNHAVRRNELSAQRQATAGYGLAALTALLATAWGYLRVDAWTKGRFSRVLSLTAVAVLAVTGVAWWLTL